MSVALRLAKVLAELSDCLCVSLETVGAGPTCFCGVVGGESPAWDYCGECQGDKCGMGYITVQSVFPSSQFPEADPLTQCAAPFAAAITIGALRCYPSMSENGDLPTEDEMLEAFLATNADMGAMLEAIQCCSALEEYALGAWSPLGPTGGCAGGEWTLTVAL
jgi:hypothetical protein